MNLIGKNVFWEENEGYGESRIINGEIVAIDRIGKCQWVVLIFDEDQNFQEKLINDINFVLQS